MMKEYSRNQAIALMNSLGARHKRFLFAISYDCQRAFVVEAGELDDAECQFDFNGVGNIPEHGKKLPDEIVWEMQKPSKDDYHRSFDIVKGGIVRGDSYLVNLTCRVPVSTNLGMHDIFLHSDAPYRLWIKDKLVCFSPETFVRIDNGAISSYPMKGTISASVPDARGVLLADEKETAEHATIVDLIRNDLSMVADNVRVERYRYIEKIQTNCGALLQSSSEISGQLAASWHGNLGDLLFTLLPAGSITGAPKRQTMDIIHRAEAYERGYYTGVMGYYSGHSLDSAVMIRFIDNDGNGQLFFKAGGGITSKSKCEEEYNEVIEKVYVPIYRDNQGRGWAV